MHTSALLRRAAEDLARLVVPVQCPGCGRWDEVLCSGCLATLAGPVRRCEDDVPRLDRCDGRPPLPVWAAATYAGPVRGVVVAWKDRGRADLTPTLAGTLTAAAAHLAPVLAEVLQGAPVQLVPVPSTAGARRRRGADLVAVLAGAAAEGLTARGVPADVAPVLARRRGVRDQVGLDARARGRNAATSVVLRAARASARGTGRPWYLLVDDIVTTGGTLAACETALTRDGGVVVGALVLAATPPPGSGRSAAAAPRGRVSGTRPED